MAELGGKSFFQLNPDWEKQPIMGLMNTHAKDMYGKNTRPTYLHLNHHPLPAEADETILIPPTGMNRKPYMELERDEDGHPVLPDRDDWPKKGIDKKALIRSYVVVAYRECADLLHACIIS